MVYYKSYRIIDGKPKLVITDENNDIIRYPDGAQYAIYDNRKIYKNRRCCKCGKDKTYISTTGTSIWRTHKCGNKDCTRHLCLRCHMRYYQKNNPNSQHNTLKYMRDWRIGQLSRYSSTGKGLIGVYIICKFLGTQDNNIKYDNFNFYIDINHSIYGNVEVKISGLIKGKWSFGNLQRHKFDTLFLICMDEYNPWKNVLRVYTIPYHEIINICTIGIYKDPDSSKGPFRYDSYICDNGEFNTIYKSIDFNNDPILKNIFRKNEINICEE